MENEECRTTTLTSTIQSATNDNDRLHRIVAYCRRFINNSKKIMQKSENITLSAAELQESLLLCIQISQMLYFCEEINQIKNNRSLSPKSKLLSLNPYIDKDRILRVGGRLQNSNLPFMEKRYNHSNAPVRARHLFAKWN